MFDFSAAEAEFRRTLELNPNLSNAHHWYGLFLSWEARHPEAITHLRRAIELDPLNLQYQCNLGQVLHNAGQSDAAVEQLKKALDMDPNFNYAHAELRQIYRDTGKYDLAMEEWKKSAAISNDPEEIAIAADSGKFMPSRVSRPPSPAKSKCGRNWANAVTRTPPKSATCTPPSATKSKPLPGWIKRVPKNPQEWSPSKSSGPWISGITIPVTSIC